MVIVSDTRLRLREGPELNRNEQKARQDKKIQFNENILIRFPFSLGPGLFPTATADTVSFRIPLAFYFPFKLNIIQRSVVANMQTPGAN